MASNDQNKLQQLLAIAKEALDADTQLREDHKVGDKFKFVRDRLQLVVKTLEDQLAVLEVTKESKSDIVHADEVVVYVHLFNVHGINFATWQKMISPSVFYEYSVNRPIYAEQAHVEAIIRNKAQKHQHGYLAVAIKKELMFGESGQDALGQPLVKIREGALKIERLIAFHHNNHEYEVDAAGVVVKKQTN